MNFSTAPKIRFRLDEMVELGLDLKALKESATDMIEMRHHFYDKKQGFTALPKLKSPLDHIQKFVKNISFEWEHLVILGIGGSALGIAAIRESLGGALFNHYSPKKLWILDNIDLIEELEASISIEKSLFLCISKSGTTVESLAQFHYFRAKVPASQFIFITDPHKGRLREIGISQNIPMFDIPTSVGGRFSVLTAVGLLPMALLGWDTEALLRGAERMLQSFESNEWSVNLPYQLACIQYHLDQDVHIRNCVMMPYSSRLSLFADWYKQLLAESTGKEGKGITPQKAIGVTDQHSQLQLYNEGPKDKLILLLHLLKSSDIARVPVVLDAKDKAFSRLGFKELLDIEFEATRKSMTSYGVMNLTLEIPELNAEILGELFFLFEASIAFLGEFYKINAFDQPGVERSKDWAREALDLR